MNEIRDNELSLKETKLDKEQRAAKALERRLLKQAQREIIDVVRKLGGTAGTHDIALALGKSDDDISCLLDRLAKFGLIRSARYEDNYHFLQKENQKKRYQSWMK